MKKKRILLCTGGSLGDIYPYLALSRELKRRGHAPKIVTAPCYRALIEREGIDYHPVRPDLDPHDPELLRRVMDRNTGGSYVIRDILMPNLRDAYADTAAAAADADMIVTHPLTVAAALFARKSGLPWATTALAPMSLFSIYDPSVLVGLPFADKTVSWGPAFQRWLLKSVSFLLAPAWKPFYQFEKELGLPKSPNPLFWGHSPQLVLGMFSPVLAAPQRDWPLNSHATGFPFFEHNDGLSVELQNFLDSGEAPIVFTLGSAAVGIAGDFFEQSVQAAQSLGQRAVLLIGRDPRNQPKRPLPPGMIAIQYAPHSTVFPRASVIVHQGGVGTTAEAMRAGRPMLIMPYSHDQPDHAARLARLGVARAIPRERYNANTAGREIQALLQDKNYHRRAREIGARVRSENGVVAACDLLVRLLPQKHGATVASADGSRCGLISIQL